MHGFRGFGRIDGSKERLKAALRDHVALEQGIKLFVLQRLGKGIGKCFPGLWVVAETEIASHDVFEKSDGLGVREVVDHETEDIDDGVESFVCMTYIGEADLVEENLLHDENSDRLGELCTMLHDPQTKRDNLRSEEEIDDLGIIGLIDGLTAGRLDKCTNHTQRGEPEVLERSRLRGRVEERIEEQGQICSEKSTSGFRVGGDTLEQGESIADPIRSRGRERWRRKERIDVDDLCQKNGHGPKRVPEDECEIVILLSPFAELEQG